MIVDTSVLIAILRREAGYENIIAAMANASDALSISSATMVEAHVVAQRLKLDGLEDKLVTLINDLNISIEPFSTAQVAVAATAHRKFGRGSGHPAKLNFGDCFSYALAKETGEPLFFKGNDFAQTDIVVA